MNLKQIICFFKGHSSYPKYKCEPIPKKDTSSTIASTIFTTSNINVATGTIYVSGSSGGWNQSDSNLRFSSGIYDAKFSICYRCKNVFWTTSISKEIICHSSRFPELAELVDWKERMKWEEKQRKKNGTAETLYNQYLMTLKLGYYEDEKDDSI